jgi:hypothetical protein
MGSQVLLDIVASMVVGGLLLIVALRMNDKAVENTYQSQAALTVQQNLTSLVENIEYDFRKIGYCRNPSLQPKTYMYILSGTDSSISFVTDLSNAGKLDTVQYFLGGHVPGDPNPDVKYLYRQVNSSPPVASNLGITEFHLRYLDGFGQQLSTPFVAPSQAQVIEITVRVEPTVIYNAAYDTIFAVWRQTRLISRNLKAR